MKIRSQKREAIMTRRQLSVKFEKENLSREKLKKIRNKLFKLHRRTDISRDWRRSWAFNGAWKRAKKSFYGKSGWHISIVKLQTVFPGAFLGGLNGG